MKNIIIAIFVLLITPALASSMQMPGVEDIHIWIGCGKGCIQIETRNDVKIRVWECGKVEVQKWEEISPNQDPYNTFTSSTSTWTTTTSDIEFEPIISE